MNGWKKLRLWLLAAAFVGGQLFVLAHGAEHADADEAPHVCQLCLTGHDLGSSVPPAAALPSMPPAAPVALLAVNASPTLLQRALQTSARGPPLP
jgi:hypothetical protein